jgi:hypothetical protein
MNSTAIADGRRDEARALVGAVPADGLADEGGQEGAGDAEHDGQDESRHRVGTGHDQTREKACD